MKMMIILIIFNFSLINANEKLNDVRNRPLETFQFGLGGQMTISSLSYEKFILIPNRYPDMFISYNIGVGFNRKDKICFEEKECEIGQYFPVLPLSINFNIGNLKNFLDIGLGSSVLFIDNIPNYLPFVNIGYKYLPLKRNKFVFRFYLSIPFYDNIESVEIPYFGIHFGMTI